MAAYIVNHILGGGSFSSRLYREVREKRGLAYGISDSLVWLDHTALFIGGTATRADRDRRDDRADRERDPPHGRERPDRRGVRQGQVLPQGLLSRSASTPRPRSPASCVQIQLDDLGIDYIDRRTGLIDAVTLDDAKRVAKRAARRRAAGHRGRPAAGRHRGRTASRSSAPVAAPEQRDAAESVQAPEHAPHSTACDELGWRRSCWRAERHDAIVQSIDNARAERIGADGIAAAALRRRAGAHAARRSTGCAHAMPTAACRCCGCRPSATISPRSARRPAGCAPARPTSSCSAPAARASAARRWRSSPATPCRRRRAARSARACISWTTSIPTPSATLLARLPLADHALRRDLEIRRHRRDPDADHRGARRRQAGRAGGAHPASCSSASPSRRKRRQAQRPARPARRRTASRCSTTIPASAGASRCSPMSDCCRRPCSASTSRAIRAGAAAALAPVLERQAAGRGAGGGRRRARGRARARRAASRSR